MDTRTHPSTGFQRNQRAETIQISSGVKRIPESENLLRAPSGQHIRRVHDRVCAYLLTSYYRSAYWYSSSCIGDRVFVQ